MKISFSSLTYGDFKKINPDLNAMKKLKLNNPRVILTRDADGERFPLKELMKKEIVLF